MAVLVGLGIGPQRWLFLLLAWTVLVYLPLRILIESSQRLGEGARRAVVARIGSLRERYTRPAYRALLVRDLAARTLTPPRILRPLDRQGAVDAAVVVVERAMAGPDPDAGLRGALRTVLAAVAHQASSLSAAATGAAADNIQGRWEAARALGGLAAVAGTLAAVWVDRWGADPALGELEGRSLEEFLAAAYDYADEAALQVDALPWTEPPLRSDVPVTEAGRVLEAWRSLLAAGLPAPRAMDAFVETVLPRSPT